MLAAWCARAASSWSSAAVLCVISVLCCATHGSSSTPIPTSRLSGLPLDLGRVFYPELERTWSDADVSQHRMKRSNSDAKKQSADLCGESCQLKLSGTDGERVTVDLQVLPFDQLPYARHSGFLVEYIYADEMRVSNFTDEQRQCIYSASVQRPDEAVAHASLLNLCDGMYGSIILEDGVYFIEPIDSMTGRNITTSNGTREQPLKSKFSDAHLLLKAPQQTFQYDEVKSDGNRHRKHDKRKTERKKHSSPGKRRERRRRRRASGNSWDYFVEVLVVADTKMANYHRENLENYVLTLFSTVASVYRHQSLRASINIVVTNLMVLKDDSQLPQLDVTERAQPTLNKFCVWQQQWSHVYEYDVAILLTREDICRAPGKCDTLGLAELGTMCANKRSCAIIEDNGLSAAFTIAHELGHVFNIPHDDEKRCDDHMDLIKDNYHIMAPTLEYNTHPWSWSPCSSALLEKFLDSGNADCLFNKPTEQRYEARMTRKQSPGQHFTSNQQCQYVFGADAQVCPYMPTCKRLWCATYYGYQVGCRTQHMPWADGTPCENQKWCYRGQCLSISPDQLKSVDGSWGSWRPWGDCSRTCGGGISRSIRECENPSPSNGGKYCIGPRLRYRSCNTEDCDWDMPSFREKQCAEFNNNSAGIHGVSDNVKWVAKYDGVIESEMCYLYCQVEGSAAFYRLQEMVIDGTPCDRESDNICVDGLCREAGCDHQLDSTMKRDRCGICGGDGSYCRKVTGEDNERRRYGYNHVVRIPSGVTNVEIRQRGWNDLKEDDNYIAVRNGRGEYLLNGDWHVSVFQQTVIVMGGSVLEYSGSDQIEEYLHTGSIPTQEDLWIEVLSVGNLYPPNIHYEYITPNERSAPQRHVHQTYAQPHTSYHWRVADEWTDCNQRCRGIQHRPFHCVTTSNDHPVSKEYCIAERPSAEQRECNIDCRLVWRTESVNDCSNDCGWGEQEQRVWCSLEFSNNASVAPDVNCNGTKPESRIRCHTDCKGRHWMYGQWTSCSVTCGGGTESREKRCIDEHRQGLHDEHCEHVPSEPIQRTCNEISCPSWVYGHWAQCSKSCDGGVRLRHAVCRDTAGRDIQRVNCNEHDLRDREQCNTKKCTMWKFGDWSQCSVTCGLGMARREAWCVDSKNKVLAESDCVARQKIVSKACELAECPRWRMTQWSQCSQSCNEGWQRRRVTCVDGEERQLDNERCINSTYPMPPPSQQICNLGSCPFWRERDWTACSVSCGSGIRERQIECVYKQEVADHNYCSSGTRPVHKEACHLIDCPQWEVSPWEKCSSSCGMGKQHRRVFCVHNDLGACNDDDKPDDSRPCESEPCQMLRMPPEVQLVTSTMVTQDSVIQIVLKDSPPTSTAQQPMKWVLGEWTPCTTKCGPANSRRQVKCRDWLGRMLEDIYCRHEQKPLSEQPCDGQRPCGEWRTGPWTNCPSCLRSDTEQSNRRRQVHCTSIEGQTNVSATLDPLCDHEQPPASEPCDNVQMCDNNTPATSTSKQSTTMPSTSTRAIEVAFWRTDDWSECSVSCGSGWISRSVSCSKPGQCSSIDRPTSVKKCMIKNCPRWEITRQFSKCSTTCGEGMQYRIIHCIDRTISTEPLSAGYCINASRPSTERTCNLGTCAVVMTLPPRTQKPVVTDSGEYSWVTDSWTQLTTPEATSEPILQLTTPEATSQPLLQLTTPESTSQPLLQLTTPESTSQPLLQLTTPEATSEPKLITSSEIEGSKFVHSQPSTNLHETSKPTNWWWWIFFLAVAIGCFAQAVLAILRKYAIGEALPFEPPYSPLPASGYESLPSSPKSFSNRRYLIDESEWL